MGFSPPFVPVKSLFAVAKFCKSLLYRVAQMAWKVSSTNGWIHAKAQHKLNGQGLKTLAGILRFDSGWLWIRWVKKKNPKKPNRPQFVFVAISRAKDWGITSVLWVNSACHWCSWLALGGFFWYRLQRTGLECNMKKRGKKQFTTPQVNTIIRLVQKELLLAQQQSLVYSKFQCLSFTNSTLTVSKGEI